jgi:hypothetical protein
MSGASRVVRGTCEKSCQRVKIADRRGMGIAIELIVEER